MSGKAVKVKYIQNDKYEFKCDFILDLVPDAKAADWVWETFLGKCCNISLLTGAEEPTMIKEHSMDVLSYLQLDSI